MNDNDIHPLAAIKSLLEEFDKEPDREGLARTPQRLYDALNFWTQGYNADPEKVLKSFEDGAEHYNDMVFQGGIPIYSLCVVGSTFVETPRGRVPISQLKSGDWVYTINPNTMQLGLTQCKAPRVTRRRAELVRVYTDNDAVICTPDHQFLTTDGEFIAAADLRSATRLASLYRRLNYNKKGHVDLVASRWTRHDNGLIMTEQSTGACPEHRFVAAALGQLTAFNQHMIPHHKDEVPWNNDPENLELVTTSEHNKRHARTLKLKDNPKRKARAAVASGRTETRIKRSTSVTEYWRKVRAGEITRNHTVVGVNPLPYKEDVWCMTVPDTHTFFANGIAVHNCEHHITPFFGVAHIGYIPNGKIVGLSKLARVAEVFTRRFQVQERLTRQIADALEKHVQTTAVGVVLRCRHLCMESRGVQKVGTVTYTSALLGKFKQDLAAREEFLRFVSLADARVANL